MQDVFWEMEQIREDSSKSNNVIWFGLPACSLSYYIKF